MNEAGIPMGDYAIDGNLRRATLTISCRDADPIPKVPNAGSIESADGIPVQIMHNGIKVRHGSYHGDWMAHIIHGLRGHHEPQEEKAFHEILRYCRPGACILELGSFWAYYSMWYLREIPSSRACCVEPDPGHLATGRENMRLNGLQASFLQASVGERFIPQAAFTTESTESLTVPQHCAASLVAHWQLDAIEVLHADIQGAELALLKSCDELIAAGRIRFFVISTHHALISGSATMHSDCVSYLRARGANILCEHDIDESFSGDGLIVAAMRAEDRIIPPIAISRCRRADSLFASGY